MLKYIIILLIVGILPVLGQKVDLNAASGKSKQKVSLKPDSLKISSDSLDIKNEVDTSNADKKIDTIPPAFPLLRHGAFLMTDSSSGEKVSKRGLEFIPYTEFSDIIYDKTIFFPLSLGMWGQFNHFSANGALPGSNSFAFNGRPITDIQFNSFDPGMIAPEFFESIEIFTGSDAVIFSDNSSGAFINIQEIRYNTGKPYTRLWIAQDGYEFISTDGIYSQNFRKNWNFTFGFRGSSSDGRYDNSEYDSWNIRGILRWNPDDQTSISLTEIFTNYKTELFGGIDPASIDYCEDISANEIMSGVNERIYRHDLTLSFSRFLSKDSSSAFCIQPYFTTAEWNRSRDDAFLIDYYDTTNYYKYRTNYLGVSGRLEQGIFDMIKLTAGGNIMYYDFPGSPYYNESSGSKISAFFRGELMPVNNIKISGGYRHSFVNDIPVVSMGGRISTDLIENMTFHGDISLSENAPSPVWKQQPDKESHFLILAGADYKSGEFQVSAGVFYRLISDPLIFAGTVNDAGNIVSTNVYNGGRQEILGGNISLSTQLFDNFRIIKIIDDGRLMISLKGGFNYSQTLSRDNGMFPVFHGGGKLWYQAFSGQSVMNLGAEIYVLGPQNGLYFFPMTRSYFNNDVEYNTSNNGINAFAEMRLGNAFLRLMFRNLLDQCWYYVPVYPQAGRNFRLTVSWSFFD